MIDHSSLTLVDKQQGYTQKCRALLQGQALYVLIETFGCQQNQADSDRLRGMALSLGYRLTDDPLAADLIIFNTCAVREHAEKKLLSKIGETLHLKAKKNHLIVAVCGCMMQQPHRQKEIQSSYPHVDIVLGTHTFWLLPEAVYTVLTNRKLFLKTETDSAAIPEGLSAERSDKITANITIMYGCNNFCTYCIVPYTRGREKSRSAKAILQEVQKAVSEGYKEIMLLGQNVNSYAGDGLDFADLLSEIDKIPGDYWLKFMTSHPKDADERLLDVMAKGAHIAKALHLPVQSGSTRILDLMNRKYTAEDYVKLIALAREKMPEIELSTDLIVGFPGETESDFAETLALVEALQLHAAFTFVYSKRRGTKAYDMAEQVPPTVKKERMGRLLALQTQISENINRSCEGKLIRVLVQNEKRNKSTVFVGKTAGGKMVSFCGEPIVIGTFQAVKILQGKARELLGEAINPAHN